MREIEEVGKEGTAKRRKGEEMERGLRRRKGKEMGRRLRSRRGKR